MSPESSCDLEAQTRECASASSPARGGGGDGLRTWELWISSHKRSVSACCLGAVALANTLAWLLGPADLRIPFVFGLVLAGSLGVALMCDLRRLPAWTRWAASLAILIGSVTITATPVFPDALQTCGGGCEDRSGERSGRDGSAKLASGLNGLLACVLAGSLWGTTGLAVRGLVARPSSSLYSARCAWTIVLLYLNIALPVFLHYSLCFSGAAGFADLPGRALAGLQLLRGLRSGLAGVNLLACGSLVLQRLQAVQASLESRADAALVSIKRIAFCACAIVVLIQFLTVEYNWTVCVALLGVLVLLLCIGSLLIARGFLMPVRSLQVEMRRTSSGAARFGARWALRALLTEIVASIVTFSSTAGNLALTILLMWTWEDSEDHAFLSTRAHTLVSCMDCFIHVCVLVLLSQGIVQRQSQKLQEQSAVRVYKSGRKPTMSGVRDAGSAGSARVFSEFTETDFAAWDAKVQELADRGFRLESLLDFFATLLGPSSPMPGFDPLRSTTNDVVREGIIPLSRLEDGSGGVALASKWNSGDPLRAERMVTHAWSNVFTHLVAAIVADACGENIYEDVAAELAAGMVQQVRARLLEAGSIHSVYWVCCFCINQHSSICSGFGSEPQDPSERMKWEQSCRNSVTAELYPKCSCAQPKRLNDQPAECELNKFEDLLALLARSTDGLVQVIAMDVDFALLGRAWCVAEIVEANSNGVPQHLLFHSARSLDERYHMLKGIDIRACQASRPEDRAEILGKIPDVEAFNQFVQALILEEGGLVWQWSDAQARLSLAGRVAARVMR